MKYMMHEILTYLQTFTHIIYDYMIAVYQQRRSSFKIMGLILIIRLLLNLNSCFFAVNFLLCTQILVIIQWFVGSSVPAAMHKLIGKNKSCM